MKIAIYVDLKSATLAGHERHGWQVLDLPADKLSQEDRQTLADEGDPGASNGVPDADWLLKGNLYLPVGCPKEPLTAVADHAAVSAWLGWRRAVRRFFAAAKIAEDAEAHAKIVVKRDKIVADPTGCVVTQVHYNQDRATEIMLDGASLYYSIAALRVLAATDTVLACAFAIIDAEVDLRKSAEIQRRKEQTVNDKAEAERVTAHRADAVRWLVSTGTESQRQRHADGVLPEPELLDLLRTVALRSIIDLPKYEKIRNRDLPSEDISYEQHDLETLTDGQYRTIRDIQNALGKKGVPQPIAGTTHSLSFTVTPRAHVATGTDIDGEEHTLTRNSLRIEATLTGTDLSVSRLLDLDEMSKGA